MTDERRVLYALVAAGVHLTSGVLAASAAVVSLSPPAWSVSFAAVWAVVAAWGFRRRRRTAQVLVVAVATLALWTIGTLVTR